MSALLERARRAKPDTGGNSTVRNLDQKLELALAYIAGEITVQQAARVVGGTRLNARVMMGTAVLQGAMDGLVEVRRVK